MPAIAPARWSRLGAAGPAASGQGWPAGRTRRREVEMPATRILVVDDEPLFGELLGGALAAAAEIEVVGIARDGETAVRLARQALPDAVLMDIEMPGRFDGIDAAVQIKRDRPETGI